MLLATGFHSQAQRFLQRCFFLVSLHPRSTWPTLSQSVHSSPSFCFQDRLERVLQYQERQSLLARLDSGTVVRVTSSLSVLFFSRRLDLVLWWFESEAADSYHMEAKERCQNPARYRKMPNIPTRHPEGWGAGSPLRCDRCHCNTFCRSASYKEDCHFFSQIFGRFMLK